MVRLYLACARWAPFVPIDPNETTLVDVMLILGYYGCHRVWLVNSPGGDITGMYEHDFPAYQSAVLISNNTSTCGGQVSYRKLVC
jgi:hypothetical protein